MNKELNKLEFEEFILQQIKFLMPKGTKIKKEDEEMTFSIELGSGKEQKVYIGNAWKEYRQSKSISSINNFLETLTTMDAYEDVDFEESKLLSVIKDEIYVNALHDKDKIVSNWLIADLYEVLILDHPKFTITVTESLLKRNMEKKRAFDMARQNLKKKGWIDPTDRMGNSAGEYLIFNKEEFQFQYQFFENNVEKYLGKRFLFTVPSNNYAFVWIPNELKQSNWMGGIILLKQITAEAYERESHPISNKIIVYDNGSYRVMGIL